MYISIYLSLSLSLSKKSKEAFLLQTETTLYQNVVFQSFNQCFNFGDKCENYVHIWIYIINLKMLYEI